MVKKSESVVPRTESVRWDGERLFVFLFGRDAEAFRVRNKWAVEFADNARRVFATDEISAPIVLHGGEGQPSALALHARAESKYPESDAPRIQAAKAIRHAMEYRIPEVVFLLRGRSGPKIADRVAEGAVLGAYRFDRYRRDPEKRAALPVVTLDCADSKAAGIRESAGRATRLAAEVNAARDLVNEPGEVVTPEALAAEARGLAAAHASLSCQVWDETALRREGYPGLLSVGQGSHRPPRLVVLRHRPSGKPGNGAPHLALVGKGITFDTGGISLKPPGGMWTMKGDMAGAAAVLRAMAAIADAGLEAPVTGIVATAENYPGPHATRPGDIFTARNGTSVMVDNTDAEGRLVLTDALARAGEEGATHVVDAATLTGAAVRALGPAVAGIMGNDPGWTRQVIEAGAEHGESLWELPLVEEYRDQLLCDSADLKNIGGINAGTITAALFLSEFVPEGAKWAHLDIAGPFLVEKPWKYYPKGATGFGVRTLFEVARRFPTAAG